MAVVGTNLTTSGSTTDGTTFATASITPAANSLIMLGISYTPTTNPGPTLTSVVGNGITYSQIATTPLGARQIALFRGMSASPTAGAITITSPASLTTCLWTVVQFTGVDTSGTNGSGAIAQSVASGTLTSNNTPSQAFTTTPSAANAGFGAIVSGGTLTAGSAGSGWSLAGNANVTASVNWILGEFANINCPAAVSATFTGTAGNCFAVGAEIIPAATGTATNPPPIRETIRVPVLRASTF